MLVDATLVCLRESAVDSGRTQAKLCICVSEFVYVNSCVSGLSFNTEDTSGEDQAKWDTYVAFLLVKSP